MAWVIQSKPPALITIALLLCSANAITQQLSQDENIPPVVRITVPANKSSFRWNTDVPYSITVSDREDGNSAYDEILDHEVLLQVTFVSDTLPAGSYRTGRAMDEEPPAITLMKTSTCFHCHAARTKLIGPSFYSIAERYADQEETVNMLASKVTQGSAGAWSDVKMPSNADLKIEEIRVIVHWILKNNKDPNSFYQAGLKGVIRTKEKSPKDTGTGVYFLTASYADHGLTGRKSIRKRGRHTIVLRLEP